MTVVVVFVSMLLAFKPPALVLDISGAAFIVILCSCGPPLVLGIWWTRATKAAAATNILVMTFLSCFSWMYANTVHKSAHFFFLDKSIVTPHQFYWVFVGFIFFILLSLVTPKCSDETIQKYSLDLRPDA